MKFTNTCMCLGGVVFLVCMMLSCGCDVPPGMEPQVLTDGGSPVFDAGMSSDGGRASAWEVDVVIGREPVTDGTLMPRWRPRAHPPGTLLEDRYGDEWVVVNWLERMRITHDGITEGHFYLMPAIRMSAEEERCLIPIDKFWDAPSSWTGMYGPDYEIYALDWANRLRRPANLDRLASWDRERNVRVFPEGYAVWNEFTDVDEPLPFRTGSLLLTERGISYFENGRRWLFESEALAAESGYDLDRIPSVSEDDVGLSSEYGTFTRESFAICPAETPLAEYHDRDGDGVPFHRDCDDEDPERSPEREEVCDGVDNNCNGMTDDLRGC